MSEWAPSLQGPGGAAHWLREALVLPGSVNTCLLTCLARGGHCQIPVP